MDSIILASTIKPPSIRGQPPSIEAMATPPSIGDGHDAASTGNHCCSVLFSSVKTGAVQRLRPTDRLSWR